MTESPILNYRFVGFLFMLKNIWAWVDIGSKCVLAPGGSHECQAKKKIGKVSVSG